MVPSREDVTYFLDYLITMEYVGAQPDIISRQVVFLDSAKMVTYQSLLTIVLNTIHCNI